MLSVGAHLGPFTVLVMWLSMGSRCLDDAASPVTSQVTSVVPSWLGFGADISSMSLRTLKFDKVGLPHFELRALPDCC